MSQTPKIPEEPRSFHLANEGGEYCATSRDEQGPADAVAGSEPTPGAEERFGSLNQNRTVHRQVHQR